MLKTSVEPGRFASGQPGSLAPTRVTRSGPPSITLHGLSHSQQPGRVTSRGPPSSAAARRHPPRAVTVVTRLSHLPRPTSLRWRCGPPHFNDATAFLRLLKPASLTQWLAAASAPKQKSASSFGSETPWSPYFEHPDRHIMFIVYEYWIHIRIHVLCICILNHMHKSYILIHMWIHTWIHKIYFQCEFINEFIYYVNMNSYTLTRHFLVHPQSYVSKVFSRIHIWIHDFHQFL